MDHFEALERVHEERFEPMHGPPRRVARAAVGRFMNCGLLEHGLRPRALRHLPCRVPGHIPVQGARVLPLVPRATVGGVEPVAG